MEVTGANNLPQAQGTSQAAASQLNTDLDSFLLLLTAQISNQDPLKPMDSTTFVSQLAQLTQVEQSIATNQNLENIRLQLSGFSELNDVQLIGRDVLVASDTLDLNFGGATMQFELYKNAEQVQINILDSDGAVIKEITDLPKFTGEKHTVNWDGFSNDGVEVDGGAYRFEVIALDGEANRLPYISFATTTVDELSFENGLSKLLLGNGDEVSSSAILAIK